jgi:LysM repeat protein/3D (Asp-Asp-Asp) domain-containing protein
MRSTRGRRRGFGVALSISLSLAAAALAAFAPAAVAHAMLASGMSQPAVHEHTVEPGETLRSIADLYGVSTETVLAANAIDDPDLLQVGQHLVVPAIDGVLHTVVAGETLREIADDYGVDVPALVSANALDGSPDLLSVGTVLVVPGAKPAASASAASASSAQRAATVAAPRSGTNAPGTYTVREGDTLRSIAEQFNLDILSLIEVNGLADPDLIRPGSTLRISAKDTVEHIVEPGETLGDIAWRYSVDSSALLAANGLSDPDRIVIGTTLVIPIGHSAGAAPAPPPSAGPAPAPPPPPPAPAPRTEAPPPPPSPRAAPPVTAPTADRVVTARVTGYALGAGAVSSRTASGTTTHWGTVAADTRLYPFGTRLRIEGLGDTVFVVEDTGSAVRGNVFDVWFPDAASARRLGARTRQITILGPGD